MEATPATVGDKQSQCLCTQGHTECTLTLTLALLHTSAQRSLSHESGGMEMPDQKQDETHTLNFVAIHQIVHSLGGKINNIKKTF